MKPPPFEYHAPTTADDARTLLGSLEDAKVLAGGQSLIPLLNFRLARPQFADQQRRGGADGLHVPLAGGNIALDSDVMVAPAIVPGSHTIFLCGNDPEAKAAVGELLQSFGWPAEDVMDLGDLGAARGMEMYLPLWLRLFGAAGSSHLNIEVVK